MSYFKEYIKKAEKYVDKAVAQVTDKVNQVDLNVIKDQFGLASTSPVEPTFPVNVPRQLEIGGHCVRFVKLLDEGGFSYVFLAKDINTGKEFAIKRLLSQEKESYEKIVQEVKFMKQLSPHPNIISILGTKSFNTHNGKVIYIMMELATESLVSRLQTKFAEKSKFREDELLRIFSDVCCAVAHMHSQQPPLIHRDLKVENVLICDNRYKLCDFGSATTKTYNLETTREIQLAEEDIQLNTTLAYRSPEMADPYSGMPINEKSDVWALGCILYKLCYFVGPFEEASKLQIMNAKYTIPKEPVYSKEIIDLIKYTLVLDPRNRPDVFDVLERVSKLRGVENPVKRPIRKQPPKTHVPIMKSPAPKQTPKSTPKQAPKQPQGGLFDMLDWHDNEEPQQSQSTQSQSTVEDFEADFEANFEEQDFEADFSKLEIEEKPQSEQKPQFVMKQLSGERKQPSPKPRTPKQYSDSNDLFSQLEWHDNTNQEVAKPIIQSPPPTQSQPQIKSPPPKIQIPQSPQSPQSPIPNTTHNRSFSNEKSLTPTQNNADLLEKLFESPMQPPRTMPPRTNSPYYPVQRHHYPPRMMPQHRGHMRARSDDYFGTTNFGLVQPMHMPVRSNSPMSPLYHARNVPSTNKPLTPPPQKSPSPFDSLNEFGIHKP